MEVAEMVLSGAINKEIASWITQAGATANVRGVGLSGKDAGLITAVKTRARSGGDPEAIVDLGFVGEPSAIDPKLVQDLIDSPDDYVPVVAPIGVSAEGQTLNINADTVAGALAGALGAKRLLLLTDVAGVMDREGAIIREMNLAEAREAIASGVASGGMIPKLETAIAAVEGGVEAVVILDGRRPHALLVELFTEHGAGTLVRA
jgi:acetylglutamate kinase